MPDRRPARGRTSRRARRARPPAAALALALLPAALLARGPAAATAPAPATAPAHATPKPAPAPATRAAPKGTREKSPLQMGADARELEEVGAYGQAREVLRQLRRRVAPDADLDLALAIDEARTGQIDSAAVLLWSPLLTRALADSMPVTRRIPYLWQREGAWINGRFDGWPWYIARARAEVAAALGRWADARDAARQAVAAHPRAGKEWLILAVCAGRLGDLAEAERCARTAAWLDPTLPEAQYLGGLFDWRAGRHAAAQDAFRAAVALDSSDRVAALALVRSRLPGAAPDTLPAELLTGVRAVGLLTSPERPKPEEFVQMDMPATIVNEVVLPLPDSLKARIPPVEVYLPILVDTRGRAVLHALPWNPPERMPEAVLHVMLEGLTQWRFNPAVLHGQPHRSWANIHISYKP